MGKHKIAASGECRKLPEYAESAQRSKIMAAVKSRGNASTELKMRRLLRANKLSGWRRHLEITGTPDFSWSKKKVALFVDGCFWHKCPHCFRKPKSNLSYWDNKVESNKARDRRINKNLQLAGWRVVRVWECKIDQPITIVRIRKVLHENKKDRKSNTERVHAD